jgi:hypothetical protein
LPLASRRVVERAVESIVQFSGTVVCGSDAGAVGELDSHRIGDAAVTAYRGDELLKCVSTARGKHGSRSLGGCRGDELARLWEGRDVRAALMLTRTFSHPVVGDVTVDCNSLTLSDRDQHVVVYSAPAGFHDAEALTRRGVLGAETGHCLS